MKHCGTKTIETNRLILRQFKKEDNIAMFNNWAADSEVTKYLTWPVHESEEITGMLLDDWIARYANENVYNWAIEIKETNELIGNISVVEQKEIINEAQIGYCMGKKFWGQGYMPEAAEAVIKYLFSGTGIERIYAGHDIENAKSGRVMEKIGMKKEGVHRKAGRNNRGIVDMVFYAILKEDMENSL